MPVQTFMNWVVTSSQHLPPQKSSVKKKSSTSVSGKDDNNKETPSKDPWPMMSANPDYQTLGFAVALGLSCSILLHLPLWIASVGQSQWLSRGGLRTETFSTCIIGYIFSPLKGSTRFGNSSPRQNSPKP